tara:strand:- start:206 stop:748 length:543 start_codon:yes stop_codon:yes gene_type:complete
MAGLLQTAQEDAETAALDDPALEQAITNIGQRLYNEDLAEQIADTVGKSETNLPRNLATIAYKLAESSDVDADGDIKEENLAVLGMIALNEVFEIAEAAGVKTDSSDVSVAFKHMVVMFAQDQGLPEDQVQTLANAMAEVNDRQLAEAAEDVPDETFEALPDEDVPIPGEEQAPQAAMGV